MAENLNPRVTVVMPVYNTAPFLRQAIESILSQTFSNFQFLIINDGSTDGSDEIIKSFTDSRIRYVKNSDNEGVVAARNKGVSFSQTEYIAMMDSDDISNVERLARQVWYLDNNKNVTLLATRLILIDDNGNETGYWHDDSDNISSDRIRRTMTRINCIGQSTVMFRKNVIEKFGYNSAHWHSEDWGLWLTLLAEGFVIAKLNEVLVQYRVHFSSMTVVENKKGVGKKILKFKYSYLKNRFTRNKFKNTDYNVLTSFSKEIFRFLLPDFLVSAILFPIKIYYLKPFQILKEYLQVINTLSKRKTNISHIFFFPFYHVGGAEKVHLSIIECVADKKPIVFITDRSASKAWRKNFERFATVINTYHLAQLRVAKKWLQKKIKHICIANTKLVMFGCNSKFYYSLIASLPDNVKCIDLLHAFMHPYEDGAEKWSLPVVSRLANRIVINKKTINDYGKQYQKNSISQLFLDRIIFIPNFTEEREYVKKANHGKLIVLYVGRDSEEKRIHLITKTARIAFEKKLPVEFHFAGDLEKAILLSEREHCLFHGEIENQSELQKLYQAAHILLIASSREGFPMVIMEAMMHGVVPVTTNVGGISEHISNFQNGVLIEDSNTERVVEDFVLAIEYFCNNRNKLSELSSNAYQYALQNFNKKKFVNDYQKLLAS